MEKTLVQRLREFAEGGKAGLMTNAYDSLMYEAADEIERLIDEVTLQKNKASGGYWRVDMPSYSGRKDVT